MKYLLPVVSLLFATAVQASPLGTPPGAAPVAPPAAAPQARPVAPPAEQQAPPAINPIMQVRMSVDSLIAFMTQEPKPARPAIARFLDREIAPLFDFDYMTQMAAGRTYYRLNDSQRTAMADLMKRMFLTETTMKLMAYGGQNIHYQEPRISQDGTQAIVRIAVVDPYRYYPTRIELRVAQGPEGWKIIDVAANGQSAIMYFRRELLQEARYRTWQRDH